MDVERYLTRIGLESPIEPTLADLERLQRAHLTAVPFENLDVFHRRGVRTGEDWSVPKIVERGLGGWCFELNGAFAALLTALGFSVTRHAATVLPRNHAPMPTHLTLVVTLDIPFLVDVGFGDSFIRPLPLDSPGPHDGGNARYGFVFEDRITTLFAEDGDGERVEQYAFDASPRVTGDFDEASHWLQTQPDLGWTKARFATRLLDGGPDRVTLLEDRIKFRRDGTWAERAVAHSEWPDLLQEWFALTP